ncbi:hypothetical protein [Olivibacter domesticus]|uniref:Uncharacterized protein n=1 Tax=Olivibacter domesticus TaxID=407022 RepID=A0A1H7WCV8_OLID1|nr:hypothetical protein [Olivibacter domesticus]SEM18838.1 hypothetical protein SAMN05661044_04501 [Olivibacter domesticus]
MKRKCIIFLMALIVGAVIFGNTPKRQMANQEMPKVEGWFFRSVSGYPVSIVFEPIALFKNGDYFEVGEEPLEELDIEVSKIKKPEAWGRWNLTNGTYFLTNSKGKTHGYKLGEGNWFPAFGYEDTFKLKQQYERTSGGDYGNGTQSLAISKIRFLDDNLFTEGLNTGIATPNAAAWKKSEHAGTYKIKGHTLILHYTNGKEIHRSFAIGASGRPPKPTTNMIFIGGDAFIDNE